jgi:hypothetical protein
MMMQVSQLVESKNYIELKKLIEELSKEELFKTDASFQSLKNQLKKDDVIE